MPIRFMISPLRAGLRTSISRAPTAASWRAASNSAKPDNSKDSKDTNSAKSNETSKAPAEASSPKPKKTQAQLDEELRLKMSGLSGDGGESGIEYEDGQPTSMKRSVRNNMFRYI